MICVLRVVEGPAAGMKCWLKKDQRLTIGRQVDSDFSIASDVHMSRNHLIVEGLDATFRLRDVGSSNGTFVNDFPISVVELCNGDRIKAGSSVFEVDLADDKSVPKEPAFPIEEEGFDEFVPNRTISADTLEHDQDITMRYQIDIPGLGIPGIEAPTYEGMADEGMADEGMADEGMADEGMAAGAPTELVQHPKSEPVVTNPADVPPAPAKKADSPAEVVAAIEVPQPTPATRNESPPAKQAVASQPRPIDGIPTKFLAGFTKTDDDHLWRQTAEAAMWEPVRLIDSLLATPWKTHLSLIVNRTQVDAVQNGTLDFAITAGESRALTETLYLLQSAHLDSVLEFYKRCLTKDAAVCIASTEPLPNEWFLDAIDVLSYPSMLFELLSSSPGRARQLAQNVQFVMFEPNTQGELCLLRAP